MGFANAMALISVGGLAAGLAGAFVIGITGATLGDCVKDEIKFNLKKDVDK